MFKNYGEILKIPGALKFSVAGFIARFPMSIVGISTLLLVSSVYNSYAIAGKVVSINVISFALAVPFLSRLIDRYGQRKIMTPSIIISSVSLMLLTLFVMLQLNVIWLYVVCVLSGVTSGSFGALVRSRWAKVVENNSQMTTAYAYESALDEVAFIFGPVIATTLASSSVPALGLIVAALMNMCGGLWLVSQKKTEPTPHKQVKGMKHKSLLRIPAMLCLIFIYISMGTMFGLIDIAVVAYATEQGNKPLSGVLLSVFALGSLFGALVYGSKVWRIPVWKLLVSGVVVLGLGSSSFILANSMLMLGIVMMIVGVTIAPTMTNVNNMISKVVPQTRLTEGLAWMTTSMTSGSAIGAFIGGYMVDYQGSQLAFYGVVLVAWSMVVVGLLSTAILRKADMQSQN